MLKRIMLVATLGLAGLLAAPSADAANPSFDCARASTAVERLLCADDGLARQDRLMAAVYRRALERVGKDGEDALRADQRAWGRGRAEACPEIGTSDGAGAGCLGQVYAERLEVLRLLSFDDLEVYDQANVQADRRTALVCLRFSAPLAQKQPAAPESYVESAGGETLAARVAGEELCVQGLAHGASHRLTVKAGLRGEGAILRADRTVDVEIPDRPRMVAFPSRGVILPKIAAVGLPIETVNVPVVRALLLRVDDADVVDGLRNGLIDRQISYADVGRIASRIGRNVWTGEIETGGAANVAVRTTIPIAEIAPDLAPGVYLAVAEDPDAGERQDWWAAAQWFVVSDIGLTAYVGQDGLAVSARRLSDAQPADVRVVLMSESGKALAETRTDAAGFARIAPGFLRGEGAAAPRAAFAYGADGDFVYVDLARPPLDLSDRGVDGRAPAGALDAFVATERGVYRPSETVHLTALLRDGQAKAVSGLPLTLKVFRQDGLEVVTRILGDKGAGGYAAAIDLPPIAATGMWRATLHADPDGPAVGRVRFLVEDFVPPRIETTLDVRREGDAVVAAVQADYLYGAPAGGLSGQATVDVRPASSPVEGYPGYVFGLAQEPKPSSYRAARAGFQTGDDGAAEAVLKLAGLPSRGYPLEAVVRAEVFDVGGRPVPNRAVQQLGNLPLLIGLKPLFEGGGVAEGGLAAFDVAAFDPDGAPVARALDYVIHREEAEYIWHQNGGRWDYQVLYMDVGTVDAGTIGVAPDAPARVARRFEDWGRYRLEVTDPATGIAASVRFRAGWWGAEAAGENPQPDKVKISLAPGPYRPGDVVTAHIEPPFDAEVTAVVADERMHAMTTATVPASGGEIALRLPAEGAAGVYILVNAFAPADGDRSFAPRRAVGAQWVPFDPDAKSLAVTLTAPAEVLPSQVADIAVAIDGGAGRAFVTVAAVDDGVLGLTGYRSPDPKAYFLGKRRLGVALHDVYGRFIDAAGAEIGRVRSGGAAEAAMMRAKRADQADLPKKSSRVVALFSGVVETDASGRATVPLALPEFSGRLRLMAQAWTEDRVGAASETLLVRRPLVASVSLPRFLAPGDAATATVALRNVNGPEGLYSAALTTGGALATEGDVAALEATLAPGGRAFTRQVRIVAGDPGDGWLKLEVVGPGGQRFALDREISVRPAAPVETRSIVAEIPPGGTLAAPADLLDDVYAASAHVVVGLNPLPDLDLPNILTQLARYPYGCAEQTISTATPLLYSADLAADMGLMTAAPAKDAVKRGVDRLLAMQTYTGGFGFWSSDYEASPWITAYATDFLVQARAAGADVPEASLDRALSRLGRLAEEAFRRNRRVASAAYALYVRARAGVADPARARRFADLVAVREPPDLALAFLGGTLAAVGDRTNARAMFDRVQETGGQSDAARFDTYGSAIRDGAAILTLMAESGVVPWTDLERRAETLSGLIRARRWLSTQEQAWIVRAAATLGEAAAAQGFAVSVDGARVDDVGVGLYRAAFGGGDLPVLRNLGDAAVTGVIAVTGAARTPAPAVDRGFIIAREYFTETGDRIAPADIKQNDLVVVVLSGAQTAEGRARALVVDYLPAGLELENARLGGGETAAFGWIGGLTTPQHAELRDDRYVAAFDLRQKATFRLAYLARAVTPGSFAQGGPRIEAMYRPEQHGRGDPATVVVGAR